MLSTRAAQPGRPPCPCSRPAAASSGRHHSPGRASFALSYVVLAWVGWVLAQHYKSYALLRIVQQRHSMLYPVGAPRRWGRWSVGQTDA